MDSSKKSNQISDIVKLKRMLKKWRKQANSSSNASTTDDDNNNSSSNNNSTKKGSLSRNNSIKGITFLKRTLSFTDISTASSNVVVPKGFLAVHVGEEMKRFVIPTNYLSHIAFSALLKEAEEEFGFQQEGVLRIPCQVQVFENILKVVELNEPVRFTRNIDGIVCGSSETQSLSQSHHHPPSPMCR